MACDDKAGKLCCSGFLITLIGAIAYPGLTELMSGSSSQIASTDRCHLNSGDLTLNAFRSKVDSVSVKLDSVWSRAQGRITSDEENFMHLCAMIHKREITDHAPHGGIASSS
jgi:hypothetical protein